MLKAVPFQVCVLCRLQKRNRTARTLILRYLYLFLRNNKAIYGNFNSLRRPKNGHKEGKRKAKDIGMRYCRPSFSALWATYTSRVASSLAITRSYMPLPWNKPDLSLPNQINQVQIQSRKNQILSLSVLLRCLRLRLVAMEKVCCWSLVCGTPCLSRALHQQFQ